jgi:hypothetical protein
MKIILHHWQAGKLKLGSSSWEAQAGMLKLEAHAASESAFSLYSVSAMTNEKTY